MDPDANFRERITLVRNALKAKGWSDVDYHRYNELMHTYAGWRANGGFVAAPELRKVLLSLDSEMTRILRDES